MCGPTTLSFFLPHCWLFLKSLSKRKIRNYTYLGLGFFNNTYFWDTQWGHWLAHPCGLGEIPIFIAGNSSFLMGAEIEDEAVLCVVPLPCSHSRTGDWLWTGETPGRCVRATPALGWPSGGAAPHPEQVPSLWSQFLQQFFESPRGPAAVAVSLCWRGVW